MTRMRGRWFAANHWLRRQNACSWVVTCSWTRRTKVGGMHRASILADSFEALLGAVYLDGGFEVAREVIKAQFDWDKLQTVSADG